MADYYVKLSFQSKAKHYSDLVSARKGLMNLMKGRGVSIHNYGEIYTSKPTGMNRPKYIIQFAFDSKDYFKQLSVSKDYSWYGSKMILSNGKLQVRRY